MALQVINVGSSPNDGTGDAIRTAYIKCNNNFAEIYSRAQTNPPTSLIGVPGDQAGMYAYDSTYFYYCYANYDGSSTIWAQVAQIGNVAATSLASGTSNVSFDAINGNVVFGVGGTSNVAVIRSTGFFTGGNITGANLLTGGLISATGNITGANILAQGTLSTTGAVKADGGAYIDGTFAGTFGDGIVLDYVTGNGRISVGASDGLNIYNGGVGTSRIASFNTSGSLTLGTSGTANLNGGNILATTTVSAASFTGSLISVSGNVNGGNLIATSNVSATGISASGNITGGNVLASGQISTSGNVQGQYLKGDGSLITGITVAGGTQIINGTTNVSTISNANVTLTVAGTANVAVWATTGQYVTGLVSATGNISGNYILGNGALLTGVITSVANINSGTSNVTVVSSGGNISVGVGGTGNVAVFASTGEYVTGLISASGNITSAANISGGNLLTNGQASSTGNITSAANIAGGNVLATTTVSAASHIGSVVSVTGAITGAGITGTSLTVSTGNITSGNIVNGGANGVGNIGSSTTYFNTVFAKATSAQYADLAENYVADCQYEPGTVVVLGGTAEVTVSAKDQDRAVAGVVSTQPAYTMNTKLEGDTVVTVALIGRVPCKVQGPVNKGDLLVSTVNGRARSENDPKIGSVIGKALESFAGDTGVIEIVVGKL